MEYIKKYETVSKFNEVEGGESMTSIIPGVGYVVENRKSYYNPQGPGPAKSYKVELYYVSHEESKATEKEKYIRSYECTDNPYVIEEKLVKTWLSEIGTDKFEMIVIKSHESVIDAKCQKMLVDKYEGKFDGESFIFSIKGSDGKLPIDLTDAVYDYGFAVYVHDTVPKTYDVNTYLYKDGKTSMIESLQRSEMYYWVENSDIKRWLKTAGLDSYSNIKCEISRDWVTEETFKELSKMELEHLYDNFYSFVIKEDGVKLTLTDSIYGRKINITVYAPAVSVKYETEVWYIDNGYPYSACSFSGTELHMEITGDDIKKWMKMCALESYKYIKCYAKEDWLTKDCIGKLKEWKLEYDDIYSFTINDEGVYLEFTSQINGHKIKIEMFLQ